MRKIAFAALAAATLLLTGCGSDADAPVEGAAPGMAMCAPGVTDCVDTVVSDGGDRPAEDPDQGDAPMTDADHRARAQQLLGLPESQLPADVRVGRRGEEHMMLTEDYVIGRRTVELDDQGDGTYLVTAVVVELEGGPETFSS